MSSPDDRQSQGLQADPSGLTTISSGRTIGEGEFALLTDLTWLTGEAHVNRLLGGGDRESRVLPPIITAAIGLGLGWTSTMRPKLMERYGLQAIRSSSLTVEGGVPLRPGDTVWVHSRVNSVEKLGGASEKALNISHEVRNEFDEMVVTVTQELLVMPVEEQSSPLKGR